MKQVARFLYRIALCVIALLVMMPGVLIAQSREYRDLYGSDVTLFDPDTPCEGSSTGSPAIKGASLPSGSKIYMLGDSITVGAQSALEASYASEGFEVQKIHAEESRSITSAGNGNFTSGGGSMSGLAAIDNDADDVAAADAVVVALGTNASGANEDGVTDMINKIRGHNEEVRIFWVNLFSTGIEHRADFNSLLSSLSQALSFTVIDTVSAGIDLSSDQIHPSGDGILKFAETVAQSMGGGSTLVAPSGCACSLPTGLSRDQRYQTTWAFFTSQKRLSEEATAGIMGNLEAESGIDPHNVQNTAPVPDGPEIPIDAIRDRYGYGIAQWTSAGRQENLINYAAETNRSTGNLGLQLDFLWKELEESYTGVLAVLQTPDVTVNEASDEVLLNFEAPANKEGKINERRTLSNSIYSEFSGQTFPSLSGGGCNSNGINIDLVSDDTSHIPCGAGTADRGVADGYRDGRLIVIRLCNVSGHLVNSQIAHSVAQMLADSAAAGAPLSINGVFRDMQAQIDIYYSWCSQGGITPTPPPYPKASWSDYQRCPGAAPPGYSNHQAGLALDLECDGTLIPQDYTSAQSNQCFQWLVSNASRYGLYEYGKGESRGESGYEAWHWSVDGG